MRPSWVLVRSPGGLPPPVTVQTLREAQAARNPTVIDVLRRLGLAEDSGQGIDVIQDSMRYELLDEPVFDDADGFFTVTLPLGGLTSGSERAWLAEHERLGRLLPNERILLLTVMRDGRITNSRAREVRGVDNSKLGVACNGFAMPTCSSITGSGAAPTTPWASWALNRARRGRGPAASCGGSTPDQRACAQADRARPQSGSCGPEAARERGAPRARGTATWHVLLNSRRA
ncbi:ATP-binding protein [Nocardioides marmoribigeumensis]|uniref:ATP-binding protein n=1 Tax=Nocardioides marmoribigeumensis TaxID=433649 RepID=UPI0035B53957